MPEGPEIRRAADRVERAIAGRAVEHVEFAFPRLRRFQKRLAGRQVLRVETRGKAMLTHFEGGLAIYSHNQLYGRWYVTPVGELPRTGRSLRLAIHNVEKSALLYSASEIDVLDAPGIEEHAFLSKLGPDVLAADLTEARLARHVGEPRFAKRQLHALLLDQGFVAGLGNYLRSEILFVAGLHPKRRPGELSKPELRALARSIRRVARQSYRSGGITNDPERAKELKARGLRRSAYRHHVFTRGGAACWSCHSTVAREVLGGRKIFHCPTCQPENGAGDE